jgi:hypothetical protein
MAKILGNALDWIKRKPPRSTFKRLFLETKTLLIPILSTGSAKSPAEGFKDSECEWGVITTRPPIPYVTAVDPYEKAEKTEIKTRLPDGTNYQMVPFCSGTNKDYVNHLIVMIHLVEQKDLEKSVEVAFEAVKEVEDKIGPLQKKLNMSKSQQEKDNLQKLIDQAEKFLEQNEKTTLEEIVKAYELIRTYFLGEARTQWDKVVQEMHTKDPWVAVDGSLNKGPCEKDWDSFLDCIELHKLTTVSCDAAKLQRYYMQQHVRKPQRITI